MPFDATKLKPYVQESRIMGKFTAVEPAKLRAWLVAEIPKQFAEKTKFKFIDCMDVQDNTGKQLAGAYHMNLRDISGDNVQKGLNKIKDNSTAWKDLNSADLVVIYCSRAEGRSPATMLKYQQMRANMSVSDRPAGYNANQTILLLSKGMEGYLATSKAGESPPPQTVKWAL